MKKTLAIVMALVLCFGIFAVTASAKAYTGTYNTAVTLAVGDTIAEGAVFKKRVTVPEGYVVTAGTFSGGVTNKGTLQAGKFDSAVSNTGTISGGTYTKSVTNNSGAVITGGSIDCTVFNYGEIKGGDFSKSVTNEALISGGNFTGSVVNNMTGEITGGIFNTSVANEGAINGGAFLDGYTGEGTVNKSAIHTKKAVADVDGHWYICSCALGEKCTLILPTASESHYGGSADCCTLAICEVCGQEYGDYDYTIHNGSFHYENIVEPGCETEGYSGDIYCDICSNLVEPGYATDPIGHEFYDGICINCGAGEEGIFDSSKIVGVDDEYKYFRTVTFTAVGKGMDNKAPEEGDVRSLPVSWSVNNELNGEISETAYYNIKYSHDKYGNYTLTVIYNEQVYTDGAWVDTGVTEDVSVSYYVTPNEQEEKHEVKPLSYFTMVMNIIMGLFSKLFSLFG